MTDKAQKKETDIDKIDPEAAQQLVDREADARKDGVTRDKVDAGSGIVLKPDANDRSVATYDPQNMDNHKQEEAKPAKSKYQSGEPVHDRS